MVLYITFCKAVNIVDLVYEYKIGDRLVCESVILMFGYTFNHHLSTRHDTPINKRKNYEIYSIRDK